LDLHEYQGKELFRRHGIPVSEGRLALDPEERERRRTRSDTRWW
jgi:succinyl-CoA synthetase beta subunit